MHTGMHGEVIEGSVTRVAGSLDEATRTLRVEIDLENTPDATIRAAETGRSRPPLRPGLYATTTIVSEEHADTMAVPQTAIIRDGGAAACVVIEDAADGGLVARRRNVTTGIAGDGLVEIVSGLAGDERVVTTGAASLADGQPVRLPTP
jgi:multidrug efflux pump subunit AcrA (membrane-fusion protein)